MTIQEIITKIQEIEKEKNLETTPYCTPFRQIDEEISALILNARYRLMNLFQFYGVTYEEENKQWQAFWYENKRA